MYMGFPSSSLRYSLVCCWLFFDFHAHVNSFLLVPLNISSHSNKYQFCLSLVLTLGYFTHTNFCVSFFHNKSVQFLSVCLSVLVLSFSVLIVHEQWWCHMWLFCITWHVDSSFAVHKDMRSTLVISWHLEKVQSHLILPSRNSM